MNTNVRMIYQIEMGQGERPRWSVMKIYKFSSSSFINFFLDNKEEVCRFGFGSHFIWEWKVPAMSWRHINRQKKSPLARYDVNVWFTRPTNEQNAEHPDNGILSLEEITSAPAVNWRERLLSPTESGEGSEEGQWKILLSPMRISTALGEGLAAQPQYHRPHQHLVPRIVCPR